MNNKIFLLISVILFSFKPINIHLVKSNSEFINQHSFYSVKKVVDGDTFWIDDGSEKGVKVRLIGVNTPETVHPNKSVEYYGKEASDYVKNLLNNKKVRLEYDVEKYDKYGRTLAYVFLEDGIFLNEELIKKGYARVMTIPPNVKYSDRFLELEKKARENNIGLWGKENSN